MILKSKRNSGLTVGRVQLEQQVQLLVMKGGQFMRVIKSAFIFVVCISLAVAALMPPKTIHGASPEAADLPANSWQIPFAPNNDGMRDKQSVSDFYEFAWQSFIALNWPALDGGDRGQPDPAKMIGAKGQDGQLLPVVWSTYKLPSEVFLPNAAAPGGWNDPPPPPPSYCKNVPPGAKVLAMAAKDQPGVMGDVNQAGFPQSIKLKIRGPVADQMLNYLRYEIRLNRSEFEYFNINQYYNRSQQIAAVGNTQQNAKTPPPNPLKTPTYQFPPKGKEPYVQSLPPYAQQGTVELKAAWRILTEKDVIDRYYHIPAYIDSGGGVCKLQTVGLVGLHILRLTPGTGPTWIWATFEQIDNVELGANAPKRPDGSALTPSLNPGPHGSPAPPYFPGGYYGDEPKMIPSGGPIPKPTAPNNISRLTDITDDVKAVNQKYQSMLSNTVWKNYELVGNLGPYVNGSTTPTGKYFVPNGTPPNSNEKPVYINSRDLANTSMEAYVQSTNCIICHAYAVPWGVFYSKPVDMNTFQSFTFLLRYANAPTAKAVRRSR
jgi:hypothetical protein